MYSQIDDYLLHVSMLPFFYETDYKQSPLHAKNQEFLAEIEKRTNDNIAKCNSEIVFFAKFFSTWLKKELSKFPPQKAEMPAKLSPEISGIVKELKKALIGTTPIEDLVNPAGDFQKTCQRLLSLHSAPPYIVEKECKEHKVAFDRFFTGLSNNLRSLKYLIERRNLTVDMGDALLGYYEDKMRQHNLRAMQYWKDKKTHWMEGEKEYFVALKSLPLKLKPEEERRLLDIIGDPHSSYYNDGARDYKEIKNEVREYLKNPAEEHLDFPIASAEIAYTPPKDSPIKFRIPVCLNRRKPVFVVCDTATQSAELHRLFDTVLAQYMRNTTCGEIDISVIDPIYSCDFLTKFENALTGEHGGTKKAVYLDKIAHCDAGEFRSRIVEFIEEVCDKTKGQMGDLFQYVEDYNKEHGEMPIHRRMLLVNGVDSIVKPSSGGSSAEADLRNIDVIIQNAAKCGVFLVLTGNEEFLEALKKVMRFPEMLDVLTLSKEHPNCIGSDTKAVVEFGHPGFKMLSDRMEIMETTRGEISSLCTGLREIAANVDLSVNLADILEGTPMWGNAAYNKLRVPFGKNSRGQICSWYADKDIAGHTLIVGGTGSGKSNLLHVLITSACYLYRPDEFQIFLVDLKKGVEFKRYADAKLPHARVVAVEGDTEIAVGVIQNVYKMYEMNYERMKKYGVNNLQALWDKGGKAPRVSLLIDEFQILFEDEQTKSLAAQLLGKIIKEGRAAGVNVILATQNPANVPSVIKDNVTTRIVMKNKREVFLDAAGHQNAAFADQLTSPGEFILLESGPALQGRSALIKDDFQKKLLAEIAKHKETEKLALPYETLVYDGTCFPSGENRIFKLMLQRCQAQKKLTLVWGQNNALNGCVCNQFDDSAGENLLIAGSHGAVSDFNDVLNMDMGMGLGMADSLDGSSESPEEKPMQDISCSQAVYWTLAQSLKPMLKGNQIVATVYDRKNYLTPYLEAGSNWTECKNPRDLGKAIFDLYRIVVDRNQKGAPSDERRLLVILNAQSLYQLQEIEPEKEPETVPVASPATPAAGGSRFSFSAPARPTTTFARPGSFGAHTGDAPANASVALQYILQYGPQCNCYTIMASNNIGVLLRDVFTRGVNVKNLFHHMVCMQMSEDDLINQLGVRSLRVGDLGSDHAFYVNDMLEQPRQRFRPYFES